MSYYVEIEMRIGEVGRRFDADDLASVIDAAMASLLDLPDDVDVAGDVDRSSVTFCVSTDEDELLEAMRRSERIAVDALEQAGLVPFSVAARADRENPRAYFDVASVSAEHSELAVV